jgi:hypothetical protein
MGVLSYATRTSASYSRLHQLICILLLKGSVTIMLKNYLAENYLANNNRIMMISHQLLRTCQIVFLKNNYTNETPRKVTAYI